MTLRIETAACRNPEELRVEKNEDGFPDLDYVTRAVGFTMHWAGVERLTSANKDEVFRRLQIAERVLGPRMSYGGEPQFFTMDDIERRIGLTTNCYSTGKRKFDQLIKKEEEEMRRHGHLPAHGR
jgi:hypothetical protein